MTTVPGGGFTPFYGTSAAAPAAAGIAALVWNRNPTLTNVEVRAILEKSCLDIMASGRDINSGNGILMADLALANTPAVPAAGVIQSAALLGDKITLNFVGVAGSTLRIRRSTDLATWQTLQTVTVPPSALFSFTDTFSDLNSPPQRAFYQLALP